MTIMLQFVLLSPKMMSLNLDNVIFFSPNVFLVLIQLASRRRYVTKKEGNVYISRGSLYFRAHGSRPLRQREREKPAVTTS